MSFMPFRSFIHIQSGGLYSRTTMILANIINHYERYFLLLNRSIYTKLIVNEMNWSTGRMELSIFYNNFSVVIIGYTERYITSF